MPVKGVPRMFRAYRFGKETVPVSGVSADDSSALIVGSVLDSRYKIMLIKMNLTGEVVWKKFYRGEGDWEAQYITRVRDGFIVSGAVEGTATGTGGRDWKGYLLKIDEYGEKLWERKYSISGNECIYSVLPISDGFLLLGILQHEHRPFLLKTDSIGNELWHRVYDIEADTAVGIAYANDEILVSVSDWNNHRSYNMRVSCAGELIKTVALEKVLLANMFKFQEDMLVIGEKDSSIYLAKISNGGELIWEQCYGSGMGLAMADTEHGYVIGGDTGNVPFLYRTDKSGTITEKIPIPTGLWHDGWIETMVRVNGQILVLGQILTEGVSMGMLTVDAHT